MSYTREFVANFGPFTSLALNAKVFDSAGVQVGATITSGFVNHGDGSYSYLATLPDAHVGSLAIYDSANSLRKVRFAINPPGLGAAGGIEFTYTLTQSGSGSPISDAALWFATDAAITNVVWFGVSDAFGVARDNNGNKPRLSPGTYYIWAQKSGYAFDVDIEEVS